MLLTATHYVLRQSLRPGDGPRGVASSPQRGERNDAAGTPGSAASGASAR
ncbi:hypothetical protein N9D63_07215 [Opitutales bacterium]|nr:hypothetical protein [Opitutales bacterium]